MINRGIPMATINRHDAKTQYSRLVRIDQQTNMDCWQLTEANIREFEIFLYNSSLALNK
jgi:hypothetical protein